MYFNTLKVFALPLTVTMYLHEEGPPARNQKIIGPSPINNLYIESLSQRFFASVIISVLCNCSLQNRVDVCKCFQIQIQIYSAKI